MFEAIIDMGIKYNLLKGNFIVLHNNTFRSTSKSLE